MIILMDNKNINGTKKKKILTQRSEAIRQNGTKWHIVRQQVEQTCMLWKESKAELNRQATKTTVIAFKAASLMWIGAGYWVTSHELEQPFSQPIVQVGQDGAQSRSNRAESVHNSKLAADCPTTMQNFCRRETAGCVLLLFLVSHCLK